jgi:hypothetical protein
MRRTQSSSRRCAGEEEEEEEGRLPPHALQCLRWRHARPSPHPPPHTPPTPVFPVPCPSQVRDKRKLVMMASRLEKNKNRPSAPAARRRSITAEATIAHFDALGLPGAGERVLASAAGAKRGRSATRRGDPEEAGGMRDDGEDDAADGGESVGRSSAGGRRSAKPTKRVRSQSVAIAARGVREGLSPAAIAARARSKDRARSTTPAAKQGLPSEAAAKKDRRAIKKTQALRFRGIAGESDRAIPAKMPKHLFSGKRGIGKTDWR